jgi:hypothetical protein
MNLAVVLVGLLLQAYVLLSIRLFDEIALGCAGCCSLLMKQGRGRAGHRT